MDLNKIAEIFVSILFVPNMNAIGAFIWGVDDSSPVMIAKRLFLILPAMAILVGYWSSVLSLLSLPFRSDRQAFINSVVVTWWDLGKAVFSYWGGFFKFAMSLVVATFGFVRLCVVGVWVLLHDLFFIPFRVAGNVGQNALAPGVPWLAVGLTLVWALLEAVIFTFVTSPLVVDTLTNLTGSDLTPTAIRIPLFLFMLFIVLGSYAVLSTWTDALGTRNIQAIVKIGVIEAVALFVEVMFLYREFVDALVPWFAQHASEGFELGIFATLGIATMCWFGIRGLSWFLFAQAGTPTIMKVIQGEGLKFNKGSKESVTRDSFKLAVNLVDQVKKEIAWGQKVGEELLGAFVLPPVQVVAAAVNFCTLLISKKHLFQLPFNSMKEITSHKSLIERIDQISTKPRKAA